MVVKTAGPGKLMQNGKCTARFDPAVNFARRVRRKDVKMRPRCGREVYFVDASFVDICFRAGKRAARAEDGCQGIVWSKLFARSVREIYPRASPNKAKLFSQ